MHEVTNATWNWRLSAVDAAGAQRRTLRLSAWLQAAVLTAAGCVLRWVLGEDLLAGIVWGLAAGFAVLGTVWPHGFHPVQRFGHRLGRAAGHFLSWVLLVPLYVLFFGLVAAYLRLRRKDPLRRAFLPRERTYWIPRREKERGENFRDQFLRGDAAARDRWRPVGAVTRSGEGGSS